MAWWRRTQTAQQRQDREDAVQAEGTDDAEQAVQRARADKNLAARRLVQARGMSAQIRREIVVNHLAADVFEAMRRRT